MDVEHGDVDGNASGSALAYLLERRGGLIADRWRERAARARGERGATATPELLPCLPTLLAELAAAVRGAASAPSFDDELAAGDVASVSDPWRVDVDVRGVVREYELLQQVIYELVEEEGARVTLAEVSAFARAVTRGIGSAVHAFARGRERALAESERRLLHLAESERERLEREHAEREALEQELLAIVSHDLRNPLSAILMTAEWLLKGGNVDAEIARALERVRSSGKRATELIEDLLDYTRARLGGGIEVEPTAARLHAIVATVVDEVRAAHPDRRIEHVREGDDTGWWDARRVGQVVANLVINAVQHSAPGSVVRVRSYGADGEVCFEVHNEGHSIPPELRPHIFEPFRGGAPGRRRLGLGLYIASRIVAAHAGRIDVSSDEEQGTTFCVVLPRDRG